MKQEKNNFVKQTYFRNIIQKILKSGKYTEKIWKKSGIRLKNLVRKPETCFKIDDYNIHAGILKNT